MGKVCFVLFDVGRVLVKSATEAIYSDLEEGLQITRGEVIRLIQEEVQPKLGSGQLSEAELWRSAHESLGIRLVSPEENLLGRVYEQVATVDRPSYDLATKLKNRGLKIGILSDTIEPHARVLRAKGLYEEFKPHVYLSHEIGLRKPDHETFEYVLREIGVPGQSVLFIDDKKENLAGAAQLGIQTVRYDNGIHGINYLESAVNLYLR